MRDDDALFRLDTGGSQDVTEAVGELLDLGIGEVARVRPERDPLTSPFLDACIQEVLGDIELFGVHDGHGPMIGASMPIRPPAEMTWEEARDAQEKAWIALLPIGAVEVLVVLSPSDGDDTVEPSDGAAGNGGGAS